MKFLKRRSLALLSAAFALLAGLQACELGQTPGGGTGGEGLTGVVVDGGGNPVVGARVRVYPAAAATALAKTSASGSVLAAVQDSTYTRADGRYRFKDLPSGTYNLEVSLRSNDTAYGLFVTGIVFDKKLDLGVDTLQASGGLTLRVQGEQGAPLAGARCEIAGSPWTATSDAAGACVFKELPPGTHQPRVWSESHPDVAPVFATPIRVSSGSVTEGGQVYVGPEGGLVPAGWKHVSIRGYDFWIPPGLELKWERQTIPTEEWSEDTLALYEGDGMRLAIGTGRMNGSMITPGFEELPGHEPRGIVLDASTKFPIRLVTRGGTVPWTSLDPMPWLATGVVTNLGPTVDGVDILHVFGHAATSEKFELLAKSIATIRKWNVAAAIPRNPPVTPRLLGPADDTTLVMGPADLAWTGFLDAPTTYYRLQISTDDRFDSVVYADSLPLVGDPGMPFPPQGDRMVRPINWVTGGKTYYWRVIAYGPGGSAVSETRRFHAMGVPAMVTPIAPADGATNVSRRPVLDWSPYYSHTHIGAYRIEVGFDDFFSTTLVSAVVTQEEYLAASPALYPGFQVPVELPANARLFWRVTTMGIGVGTVSKVMSFTTGP